MRCIATYDRKVQKSHLGRRGAGTEKLNFFNGKVYAPLMSTVDASKAETLPFWK